MQLEKFREEFEANKDNLKNGPPQNRSTTDILCCLIFIVFMIGMGAVFVYGVMHGKLSNITIGWDADGNGCGFTPGFEEYPYLYWVKAPDDYEKFKDGDLGEIKKAVTEILKVGVCVKKCPSSDTNEAV